MPGVSSPATASSPALRRELPCPGPLTLGPSRWGCGSASSWRWCCWGSCSGRWQRGTAGGRGGWSRPRIDCSVFETGSRTPPWSCGPPSLSRVWDVGIIFFIIMTFLYIILVDLAFYLLKCSRGIRLGNDLDTLLSKLSEMWWEAPSIPSMEKDSLSGWFKDGVFVLKKIFNLDYLDSIDSYRQIETYSLMHAINRRHKTNTLGAFDWV